MTNPPEPGGWDLRLGRWQDVLADVECDAKIDDPPYGQRTHEGHNEGSRSVTGCFDNPIDYTHWTPDHVHEFVRHWSPRTRGWMVSMTSHDLIPAWEAALSEAGRLAFAPLPYVDMGKGPRVLGDGPASWTVQIIVARPRSQSWLDDWRKDRSGAGLSRSLPGAYLRGRGDVVWKPANGSRRIGGKPLGVMRAIVRDYSRPGDVVCDPFAGHGTTLLAAAIEGRRAVGSEMDAEAHAAAVARLSGGYTPDLFAALGCP
jgi:site-specific DNA-methyltransferase (adenine-specific)